MHPIDWAIVVAYLVWIVWGGLKHTKATDEIEGYFLAKRSPALVGGRTVRHGHAAVGHHAVGHDGPGIRRTGCASSSSTSACRSR